MPTDVTPEARQERIAALVDAMILAASADGELQPVEMETIIGRIIERPEFEGVQADDLAGLVEGSARRLSRATALGDILEGVLARLPTHRERRLAFALATSVVLADRQAQPDELGLLKTMQAALGVSEDEVAHIFEVVERGGSLAEATGETRERMWAETMVLVSVADGEVQAAELERMVEAFAQNPVFEGLPPQTAGRYLRDAASALSRDGVPGRLSVLARTLGRHDERRTAFGLALRVAHANGQPSADALRALDLLQGAFGLSGDEVARLSAEGR